MAVIFVILWYNRMTCKNGRIMGNSLGSLWKTWKGGAAMVYTTHYQSPLGALLPGGQGDALAGLWLEGQKYFLGSLEGAGGAHGGPPRAAPGRGLAVPLLCGERPDSGELKLDPGGGEFRRTVWEELCRIPYGSVTTYGALARTVAARLGRASMSAQAVGGAVGHNPISILIPCHRVVGRTAALPDTPGESTRSSGFWTTRGWRRTASSSPTTAPRRKGGAHGEKAMQVGQLENPRYIRYHDEEWGRPHYDDGYLFELLVLESFQAGLSWECILNKRESFRTAFDGFDCRKVAAYTQEKMDALAADPSIVRNRRKIAAAVNNARIFLTIQEEFGSFSNYLWHFTRGSRWSTGTGSSGHRRPCPTQFPGPEGKGMRFVGSVIIYSYLQAAGIIDDHEPECDFCCGRQRAKEQPLGIE